MIVQDKMPGFMENKKAVLFDLDGTLIDSMWMWKDIDIEYLGRYGLGLPDDLQDCIEGMSYTETAHYFKERFCLSDPIDEIKRQWNALAFDKYTNQVPFKKGAREFLERLKNAGIPAGIATSNSRELVDAVLDALDAKRYFEVITTSCEVERGKPYPDIYLDVAAKLSADPRECIVFEDVANGILAGVNAGMEVCAVDDPYSMDQLDKKRELAHYYINDFHQLMENRYELLKEV